MGAQADLDVADIRALAPLPLWSGILAGPIAWALDLLVSYALVKWVCVSRGYVVLHGVTLLALAIVMGGAMLSWRALRHTRADAKTDGGRPRERARFMAVLGLTLCALFALQIVAGAIPIWVLDACQ